jgi:hypothetical protein
VGFIHPRENNQVRANCPLVNKLLYSNKFLFLLTFSLISIFLSQDNTYAAIPNKPSSVNITTLSGANTKIDSATVSVSWTPAQADASHGTPFAYIVTAQASGQTTRTSQLTGFNNSASSLNTTIEGLTGGISYDFIVEAKNGDGSNAANSAPFTPKSVPVSPNVNVPTTGAKQIRLSWTAPTNTGGLSLTGYTVTASGVPTKDLSSTDTATTITGLIDATEYTFRIVAKNSLGSSEPVDFAASSTPSVPTAPSAPTVTVDGSKVKASWSTPSSNGGSAITGYTAYLIGSTGADVSNSTTSATTTEYEFTSVSVGTYTVKVIATNAVGDSVRSTASISATVESTNLAANNPSILPSALGDITIGESATVTATAPSGEVPTIQVSSNPNGSCSISGSSISAISAGTCTITASTVGNASFSSGSTNKTISILKKSQTIIFPTISNQTNPGTYNVSASTSSGLSLTFSATGDCTISGSIITFSTVGSCTVTATQGGNSTYLSKSISRSFTILDANSGGFGGGGGGGSSLQVDEKEYEYIFKIVDSKNLEKLVLERSCLEIYLISARNEVLKDGGCSENGSDINLKLKEGNYKVIVYTATNINSKKEYSAELVKGKLIVKSSTKFQNGDKIALGVNIAAISVPNKPKTETVTETVVKKGDFFALSSSLKNLSTVISNKPVQSLKMKMVKSLRVQLASVGKGSEIKLYLANSASKKYLVVKYAQIKSGKYLSPIVKFNKVGKYTLTIKFGNNTRVINLEVTK